MNNHHEPSLEQILDTVKRVVSTDYTAESLSDTVIHLDSCDTDEPAESSIVDISGMNPVFLQISKDIITRGVEKWLDQNLDTIGKQIVREEVIKAINNNKDEPCA